MHPYVTPDAIRERILKRLGKPFATETIAARRSALVVVDMQNHYVAEGFPAQVPVAREIVPNINRAAAEMRRAGGNVIWIVTTATGALEHWGAHHRNHLSSASAARRLKSLAEDATGFQLYPELEPTPVDALVKKIKYDAFAPDSSDLERTLVSRSIDTLLIAGTKTNVCCESTARSASLRNYRVIMLADANATSTDAEHAATLDTFSLYFGDVMTVDEALARLV